MEEKKKKSKVWLVILGILLIAGAVAAYLFFFNKPSSDEVVYTMPVSQISSGGSINSNRFSGVVEAQDTVNYKIDSGKKVKKTYVEVGDEVKVGDILFSYDVDAIKLEIEQIKIDIQRYQAEIESNKKQIENLTKEKASAPEDMQLDYSLRIQELQNSNSSLSYSIKAKNNELSAKKDSLENTDVLSTVDGTVKSISTEGENYISITKSGEFLIKGTISELNIQQMPEGTSVTVICRTDGKQYSGFVTRIDTGSTTNNTKGDYYYGGYDTGDSATKYYFYVELYETEGLFLGQHVIIKNASSFKEGLWLAEWYIVDTDTNPYVWINNNGKLKKQNITLGKYDENTNEYEIVSGLKNSDYIAYPDDSCVEGATAVTEY